MELAGDPQSPPFWSQSPATFRRLRPQPSPLLNPVVLILAITILFLLILYFILPPFLSHTNQLLRPNSVKRGWDSLNIVLVLFAIICGVFARKNDEAPPSDDAAVVSDEPISAVASNASGFVNKPSQSFPGWLDFPDRKEYDSIVNNAGGGRLRRSVSSYPDLRQESLWGIDDGGNRSRFYDDFEVDIFRAPAPEIFERHRRRSDEAAEIKEAATAAVVTEIPVDKFVISSAPPPPLPQSLASPPPPPSVNRRRSLHSVPRKERRRDREAEISEDRQPAPPPAPLPEFQDSGEAIQLATLTHRKKSGATATKEFATAIASLYKGQRKRKKRSARSRDIYDTAAKNSPPPSAAEEPPSAPPPPPPPPPPSKVLQNLFKKSGKSKRVHSVPTTAPPPPPPPPNSIFNNLFKTGGSISKRFQQSSTAAIPPPPPPPSSILNSLFETGSKSRRFNNVASSPPPPTRRQLSTGKPPKPTRPYHDSVIIAPPPPPPPPFKLKEFQFVARGDFVRIKSEQSSRCSSPELEDVDVVSVKSDGGDSVAGPSVTCPSPDVNVKADTFIARLRDEWRLEKMNSIKEKRKLA